MQFIKDIKNIRLTAKFWVAVATVAVVFVETNFGADSQITQLIVGVLGALGVYSTPNKQ